MPRGGQGQQRGGVRHDSERSKAGRFIGRFANAFLRLGAFYLTLQAHHYLLDGRIVAMFPLGTPLGDIAHGFTQLAFFGIYGILLVDGVRCFLD